MLNLDSFSSIKQKIEALDKRDQIMLGVLVVALVLYILVGQLFLGIMDERDRLAKRVDANNRLLTWMESAVDEIQQSSGGRSSSTNSRQSLSQLAQAAAKRSNMTMSRFQPKGEEAQVWLEKVDFADVLSFLSVLEEQYGVQVLNVSINSANQPGMVNCRVKFKK